METNKDFNALIEKLQSCTTISIAGLEKNTGKTTTLNFIMNIMKHKKIGVTSIGHDGESKDIVTSTYKPRIYIKAGTIIATSKSALLKSDATLKILEVLNISTPLGDIIIAESITSGFAEISGPSTKKQVKAVLGKLKTYGAELSIVDGALSRKSFISKAIADGVILCTGAAFSENIYHIAEDTISTVELLSIPTVNSSILNLYNKVMKSTRISFIYNDTIKQSKLKTSIAAHKEVISNYSDNLRYVFIKGILTDKFMLEILNSNFDVKRVSFVVEDGTKIFMKTSTYHRLKVKGGIIKAIDKINLLGISINPVSPKGITLNYKDIYNALKAKTTLPVFNVKNFNMDVIE